MENCIRYSATDGIEIDRVVASNQFQTWLARLDREQFNVRAVHFQSVDIWNGRVGYIKFEAEVIDTEGRRVDGVVFMRGGSVAILVVFRCKGSEYAVLVVQPRLPTGSFEFEEIAAGMLDGSGNFAGVAARELKEELDIEIQEDDLLELSGGLGTGAGFYPSPGGCDEVIRLFYYVRDVSEDELTLMNGKLTGCAFENERIRLKIVPIDRLWSIPDGKTLVAISMYQRLASQSI